ncbi:MAG: phosphotransferase [Actinomycetota bacterium]|nr:phosphotransferase [Actinomycetota bacterium]
MLDAAGACGSGRALRGDEVVRRRERGPAVLTRPPLVTDPDLVTAEWLTHVLRHDGAIDASTEVDAFVAEDIGTGQVGANVRYRLGYAGNPGPGSVVCKFSSRDPVSAAGGIATLTYETEVAFYRDLADRVAVSRPHCHWADIESGTADVVLVLEDLAPATQADQIVGCTVEQAALAVDEAAALHATCWDDPALTELAWLDRRTQLDLPTVLPPMWKAFVERYESTLDAVTLEEGRRLVASVDAAAANRPGMRTAVHGDFRLDNMLFASAEGGRPITVVDWQTVQLGAGASDVAYFLGSAFAPEVRRDNEEDLVRRYHAALTARGVTGYSFDECFEDYRRSAHACMIMAVFASMLVGRTDRGDTMFMAMANRSAAMAADHDTVGLLTGG